MTQYLIIWQNFRGYHVLQPNKTFDDWLGLLDSNLISEEIDWALLIDIHGEVKDKFHRGDEPR